MKLETSQTDNRSKEEIFDSLTNEQWKELYAELQTDPRYVDNKVLNNLQLIMTHLDIKCDVNRKIADSLFYNKKNSRVSDLIFSISTYQDDWFNRIIEKDN